MSIALATSHQLADLWAGDRLLLDELRRGGWSAHPVVWDDEDVEWREWDLVVIRSCWDYHLKIGRFRAWLDHLDSIRARVINPTRLLRWNLHKGYLLDVARAGGRIPPTVLVGGAGARPLGDELRGAGWSSAVIKPAISASGHSTRLVGATPSEEDERAYEWMLSQGDVLLQAYVPEVRQHGEWSLVFFEGRYSHAALKRAAPGEFRVHIEWGGTVESAMPPGVMVREAQALVDRLDLGAAYARVDGVEAAEGFVVMELELIEPELFFDRDPDGPARLADAVRRVLASTT